MKKSINAIRFLGMDAINKANSGHPGIVLGAAPIMYNLFTEQMHITPNQKDWFNRDRFILAAGHGSAMLYATLHLSGYNVTMEDLKQFRQLNSKTPGHPEYKHTDGIDATSGPLGQGIAMAAGMAVAEQYLRASFNKDKFNVVDHFTYALCGDGDLQEGVTQEAMSLAGRLGLGRLIVLYDSNDIQLDGPVDWANTENVKDKYEAMNWHYIKVSDANDLDQLTEAINIAKGVKNRPSIIEVKSIIGFGSSKQGDSATHGAPLGVEETNKMRQSMSYPYKEFEVGQDVYDDFFEQVVQRGETAYNAWEDLMEEYKEAYPEEAGVLTSIINGELTIDFEQVLPKAEVGMNEATRVSGGKVLTALSEACVALIGGSADLTKSTKAKGINGTFDVNNPLGRNINYGVREHAMAAMVNGVTLHGLKGFSGAFFVFSDYLKPAVRMAAIMNIPSTFIFTHDSVAVGEDGPTHEPIEQLSMFRTTPNVNLLRPANAQETNYAYRFALESTTTPSVIVLSRQNLELKVESSYEDFSKGAYVVRDVEDFDGILIAAGSEVNLALDAQEALQKEGIKVRVVSMPSMDVFNAQSDKYKESVLPSSIQKRMAIEMGATHLWYRYAKEVLGIDRFGVSAPGDEAIKYFGFTTENVVKLYKNIK
jgi:transketolase